jgi:hypothetical protein
VRPYLFVLFAFLIVSAAPARASSGAPETCDGNFWSVMGARAWMEGKSDLEAAQTLIEKQRSVLQLSCFNSANNHMQSAGQKFSGGRSRSSYVCGQMKSVWDDAKCVDFDIASFRTRAQNVAIDPRSGSCNDRGKWQTASAAAYPVPAIPAASGGMDKDYTFLHLLTTGAPYNTGGCTSLKPILTGLIVDIGAQRGGPYPDAICLAPGCSYNQKDNKCEDSFVAVVPTSTTPTATPATPASTTPATPSTSGP